MVAYRGVGLDDPAATKLDAVPTDPDLVTAQSAKFREARAFRRFR